MARDNGGIIGPVNDPTEDSASGIWSIEEQYQARLANNWPNNAFIGQNSLRFDDGSSDYLSRTPASASNRKTWTWSCWFKLGSLSIDRMFLTSFIDANTRFNISISDVDKISFQNVVGGTRYLLRTDAVYRDPSAWYHLVVAVDTTQATDTNRVKLYINGTQQSLTVVLTGYPTLNQDTLINSTTAQDIGRNADGPVYYDGYMSDVYLIDGKQLEPTYFGAFDANGVWTPAASFTGDYGTNGFHLVFEDSSNLGKDSGPGGNDFTVNNLTSIDQTTDYPVNNFATWNPLANYYSSHTFSNGNTTIVTSSSKGRYSVSTLGVSQGKYYFEAKLSAITSGGNSVIGIESDYRDDPLGGVATGYGYWIDGRKYNSGTLSSYGNSYTTNDIIGVAVDLDNRYIYFAKNGTWQNSGDPTSGASGTGAAFNFSSADQYFMGAGDTGSTPTSTWQANFGNPPFTISSGNSDANGYGNFEYAVPSGYYALCTKNLAEYG